GAGSHPPPARLRDHGQGQAGARQRARGVASVLERGRGGAHLISTYLDSLSSELHVPRRARARILAETRDHLEESLAAGRSPAEAVAAFGEPAELAERFHEQ